MHSNASCREWFLAGALLRRRICGHADIAAMPLSRIETFIRRLYHDLHTGNDLEPPRYRC